MERSLLPLVKACVEGVNVAVLTLGSAASRTSALLFEPIQTQSVVSLLFQTLLASLHAKAGALASSGNSRAGDAATSSPSSAKQPAFAFELSVSFVEFYEETMTVRRALQ